MEEISRTEAQYVAAISGVLEYIQTHLDDELSPRVLARVACFSEHHFHRIFRAVAGESVMDHVRRLRLERAAYRLKTSQCAVSTVALDAGYAAQEAFTRVFRAYYGLAPRVFRRVHAAHLLPAASGVHFAPGGFTPLQRAICPEVLESDQLCEAHRNWSSEFEERWDDALHILFGFAETIFPPQLRGTHPFELEKQMIEAMTDIDKEIDAIQNEVAAAKERLNDARKRRPKELVQDYVLKDPSGAEVHLSELFGDKNDLILVHNMGTGCAYCTLWADGFIGLTPHLSDRAGFVLCSPDKPDVLKNFAEKRHWNFKTVSANDSSFIKDMGFWNTEGPKPGPWPGVSTFRKEADGSIYRIGKSLFGPGDDFCAVWPFLDLLENGANGWEPQYYYGEK